MPCATCFLPVILWRTEQWIHFNVFMVCYIQVLGPKIPVLKILNSEFHNSQRRMQTTNMADCEKLFFLWQAAYEYLELNWIHQKNGGG